MLGVGVCVGVGRGHGRGRGRGRGRWCCCLAWACKQRLRRGWRFLFFFVSFDAVTVKKVKNGF